MDLATPSVYFEYMATYEVNLNGGKIEWAWPGLIDPVLPTFKTIRAPDRSTLDKLFLLAYAKRGTHSKVQAFVLKESVLRLMRRRFDLEVTPIGRNTKTNKPAYWVITFEIERNKQLL